jgi:hypothetical protein
MRFEIEDEGNFRPFELRIRFDTLMEAKKFYELILAGIKSKEDITLNDDQILSLHEELGAKITLADYQ